MSTQLLIPGRVKKYDIRQFVDAASAAAGRTLVLDATGATADNAAITQYVIGQLAAANATRIAASLAARRCQVFFPDGDYALEAEVVPADYVGIAGESERGTIFRTPSNGAAFHGAATANTYLKGLLFENFTIDCSAQVAVSFSVTYKALNLPFTIGLRYRNITAKNSWATSLALDYAIDAKGHNITIYNAGRGLAQLDQVMDYTSVSGHSAIGNGSGHNALESHTIEGLTIIGAGFTGIFYEKQPSSPLPVSAGVKVSNALIMNANVGVFDAGANGMEIDAKFYGNRRNVVRLDNTFLSTVGGRNGAVSGECANTGNWARTATDLSITSGSQIVNSPTTAKWSNNDYGTRLDAPGIPGNAMIMDVIDQNNVKITVTATATASGVTGVIGFAPKTVTDAVTTSGSTTVTSATGRFSKYFDTNRRATTLPGFPAGTFVSSVNSNGTTLTMSQAASVTATGVTMTLGAFTDGGDVYVGNAPVGGYSFRLKAHDGAAEHVNSISTSVWGPDFTFDDQVRNMGATAYNIAGAGDVASQIVGLTIAGYARGCAGDGVAVASDTDLLTVSARLTDNTGVGVHGTGVKNMNRARLSGDVRGCAGGGYISAHTLSTDSVQALVGADTSGPSNLRITATGDQTVSLALTEPFPTTGVTDYDWQFRTSDNGSGAGAWGSFAHTASVTPSMTITGLTNGTRYDFRAAKVVSGTVGSYTAGPVSAYPAIPWDYIDTFNRADSATVPGSTESGTHSPVAWAVTSAAGGTIGIVSNSMRPTAGGVVIAAIDPGIDHGTVEWTIGNASSSAFSRDLAIRAADDLNFVGVKLTPTGYQLIKRVAGTETSLHAITGVRPVAGDVIRVAWTSTSVSVWINGTLLFTQASTDLATNTKVGLWGAFSGDVPTRFQNFRHSVQTAWPSVL